MGDEKRIFNVHKLALERMSPYFKTLLNTSMETREIVENRVVLDSPVDTVDAWIMCIQYIYTSTYTVIGPSVISTPEQAGASCLAHARVYVLAQRLCMEPLKQMALETMLSIISWLDSSVYLTPEYVREMVETIYISTADEGDEHDEQEDKEPASQKGKEHVDKEGVDEKGKQLDLDEQKTANSKDEKPAKEDSRVKKPAGDPMRKLIAKYTASEIVRLRGSKDVRSVIYQYAEFSRDLVEFVAAGTPINEKEFKKVYLSVF